MTENKSSSPSYYAILIGINGYSEQPLKGCVRDVRCIESLLKHQSFPIDIRALTATSTSENDATILVEDRSDWPTYDNVTKAIRDLTKRAQPGDYVYIHYSGHGTYMNKTSEFTNHHTGDLALALLDDKDEAQTRPFGGHRMGMALNAMVIRKLVVTLVLDCCFAASVYRRDQTSPRFISVNQDIAEAYFIDDELASQDDSALESGRRDVSMSHSWLIDPKGYAVLAACGPNEESTEVTRDGIHYGALSRFLYLGLKDGGLKRRHKDIFYRLYSRFLGHAIKQSPALYGNKDQTFFGPSTVPSTRPTIPVERSGENLILQAGEAHGISEGDDFILYPITVFEEDEALHSNIIRASVEMLHPLTSLLRLEDTMISGAKVDWVAEPQTKQALRKFHVSLDEDVPRRDEWMTAFAKNSISVHSSSSSYPPTFLVALVGDKYKIRDTNGQDLMHIPTLQRDRTSPDDIAAIINHLTTYRLVKELTNHSTSNEFRASFNIGITTRANDHFDPEHSISVTQGNSNEYIFELWVQNNGGKNLYVYIYDLGPLWQIDGIYHGSYSGVPPKSLAPRRTGRFSMKLGTSVPKELIEMGIQYCHDTLKVLVTSQPTCFDLLELPEVGSMPEKKSAGRRQGSGDDGAEEWAAFNFPIKTSLAMGLGAHVLD
ncbi:hypothetical protein ACHAPU_006277 [Fusarium lateritium]